MRHMQDAQILVRGYLGSWSALTFALALVSDRRWRLCVSSISYGLAKCSCKKREAPVCNLVEGVTIIDLMIPLDTVTLLV